MDSLRAQTRAPDAIVVVNNGSTDGTAAWLDGQRDLVVVHQANLGGAGGFNRGLKEAYRKGHGWFWIMDDDVICEPAALAELLAPAGKLPECAFLCSRVVNASQEPLNVPEIDMRPSPVTGYPAWPSALPMSLMPVRAATFVSILLPRRTVDACGYPFTEMFIWGDDTEYTTRATKDARAYLVANSTVLHMRANSSALSISREANAARLPLFRYYYRNTVYRFRKFGTPVDLVRFVYKAFFECIRSLGSSTPHRRVAIVLQGLFQGITFEPRVEWPP